MGHLNAEDYILMESTTVNPTVKHDREKKPPMQGHRGKKKKGISRK